MCNRSVLLKFKINLVFSGFIDVAVFEMILKATLKKLRFLVFAMVPMAMDDPGNHIGTW
jgi:hypothetical protein